MRKILLSILHNWCEKILPRKGCASGEKTLEIRKTQPDTYPCEVYLYEVQQNGGQGMVVGKFTVTSATEIVEYTEQVGTASCLTPAEFAAYSGGKPVYGWTITEPERFDKPVSIRSYGFHTPPHSWHWISEEDNGQNFHSSESLSWSCKDNLAAGSIPSAVERRAEEEEPSISSVFYGVCSHCGQMRYFKDESLTQGQRNESATLNCKCHNGEEYRKEQERENRIRQEVERAEICIETQFGAGAERIGKDSADNDQLILLLDLAERVIRRGIKSATLALTDGMKAKLSRTSQGVTVIARTDTDSVKTEV